MGITRALPAAASLSSRARASGVRTRTAAPSAALPTLRDLLKLSKYRLSGLVALTASAGYILRAEYPHHQNTTNTTTNTHQHQYRYFRDLSAVTAGTWLTAACANTLNQIYEVRSDALMPRTRLRPLPAGRVRLLHAGLYAAAAGLSGLALLAAPGNDVVPSLGAANIALYAAVYTPLKPVSALNTWVGAVVGAVPPLMGWAAASGGHLRGDRERGAWALAAMLFLWQIPHFHALAVVSRADYAAGGLKMLAVSHPARNALWARLTAVAMVPMGAAFTTAGVASAPFAWEAAALGLWLVRGAARMAADPTAVAAARPLFRASIVYLPLALALLVAHRVPYAQPLEDERVAATASAPALPGGREIRVYQPWEVMAPFPFLPVPCGVPAVVWETNER